jgi:hypothetical protein
MPLKPSVICDVVGDIPSMKNALGPRLAKRFIVNPKVAKYSFVLKFPGGVVTERAVSHALKKMPAPRGPTLLAGLDFTVEAMRLAKAEGCDVAGVHEFFWTDAGYADRWSDRPLKG